MAVSIGETVSGSTCGGSYRPFGESPCESRGPVAYFYVDVDGGVSFRVNSTTPLNMAVYNDCANAPQECTFNNTTFAPSYPSLHLFSVQLNSDTCGDYSFTLVNQ